MSEAPPTFTHGRGPRIREHTGSTRRDLGETSARPRRGSERNYIVDRAKNIAGVEAGAEADGGGKPMQRVDRLGFLMVTVVSLGVSGLIAFAMWWAVQVPADSWRDGITLVLAAIIAAICLLAGLAMLYKAISE